MSFSCDSVHTASRLVQDMAQVFGITALSCESDFPKDLEALRQLLVQVADYNSNRVTLSTDMADMCNMVKERVVKAEDCRIILDIARARSAYVTPVLQCIFVTSCAGTSISMTSTSSCGNNMRSERRITISYLPASRCECRVVECRVVECRVVVCLSLRFVLNVLYLTLLF